jgi:hypothetical protein
MIQRDTMRGTRDYLDMEAQVSGAKSTSTRRCWNKAAERRCADQDSWSSPEHEGDWQSTREINGVGAHKRSTLGQQRWSTKESRRSTRSWCRHRCNGHRIGGDSTHCCHLGYPETQWVDPPWPNILVDRSMKLITLYFTFWVMGRCVSPRKPASRAAGAALITWCSG